MNDTQWLQNGLNNVKIEWDELQSKKQSTRKVRQTVNWIFTIHETMEREIANPNDEQQAIINETLAIANAARDWSNEIVPGQKSVGFNLQRGVTK